MRFGHNRWWALGALALNFGLAFPGRASAEMIELIVNGNFNQGFTGWTTLTQSGGAGGWFLQKGTTSPLTGLPVPPPPSSTFAAMTDEFGPSSQVLYQDFTVPAGVQKATLTFSRFVGNRASSFFTPATLDYRFGVVGPNQQARIDLMTATANRFSVAPGDVLLNLFQTKPGDPLISGYTTQTTDVTSILATPGTSMTGVLMTQTIDVTAFLTARAGDTVSIRLAESNNMDLDHFSATNFSLSALLNAGVVPEPSGLVLLGVGSAGLLVYAGLRRKPSASPRGPQSVSNS